MPSKREVRDSLLRQGAMDQWRRRLRERFWVAVLVVVLIILSAAVGYLLAKEEARDEAQDSRQQTLQTIESDVDALQEAVGALADSFEPFVVLCADGQRMTGLQVYDDGSAAAICAAFPD